MFYYVSREIRLGNSKKLICIDQSRLYIFSHRENSKMFNITSNYFSFSNNKLSASWVAYIARDFLICGSFYSLAIVTKVPMLDVADVLGPTVIIDIFTLQSWILINLEPILPLFRNHSINSNGKENSWLLWDGKISISNDLRKELCTR